MVELLRWLRHWFRRPQVAPAVPVGIVTPPRRPPGFALPEEPAWVGSVSSSAIMRERRRRLAEWQRANATTMRIVWRPGLAMPHPRDRGNRG